MNKKKQQVPQKTQFERPIDEFFYGLEQKFSKGNKAVYAILIGLSFFGVMGVIWMIPFPKFDFLVRMKADMFLNWGSFFIAIVVYIYLRLAPTLSYAVLLCIGVMSFFIVQLEYIERNGGPSVLLVSTLIAALSLIGLWLYTKKETSIDGKDFFKLLGYGPIWLWSKVFDKLKLKY